MAQYDVLPDETVTPENRITERKWPAITACLFATTGAIITGMVLGFSSPTEDHLHQLGLLPSGDDVAWFSSVITLGAMIGSLVTGWSVDYFGRKTTVMLQVLPSVFGWMLIAYANGPAMLICGRVLTGTAIGGSTVCIPLYIAEIASKTLRGALGACFQLFGVTGVLLVYLLGRWLDYVWLSVTAVAVTAVMVVLMFSMPETPRWLLRHGMQADAHSAVTWLRRRPSVVNQEWSEIQENLDKQTTMSWREFGNRSLFLPLLITLCLMFFQQASGVICVMFNAQEVFKEAGFQDPNVASIIIGAVQVGVTAVAVVLIDRIGRRVLLIISGSVMTVCCTGYGVYHYLITKAAPVTVNLVPFGLTCIIVDVAGFSIGWGPITWLLSSELFPVRARGLASGIAVLTNWFVAFLVSNQFQNLQNGITVHGTFWLFAGICFLGVLFVGKFLPETKGRSLEEIEGFFTPAGSNIETRSGISSDISQIQRS